MLSIPVYLAIWVAMASQDIRATPAPRYPTQGLFRLIPLRDELKGKLLMQFLPRGTPFWVCKCFLGWNTHDGAFASGSLAHVSYSWHRYRVALRVHLGSQTITEISRVELRVPPR